MAAVKNRAAARKGLTGVKERLPAAQPFKMLLFAQPRLFQLLYFKQQADTQCGALTKAFTLFKFARCGKHTLQFIKSFKFLFAETGLPIAQLFTNTLLQAVIFFILYTKGFGRAVFAKI